MSISLHILSPEESFPHENIPEINAFGAESITDLIHSLSGTPLWLLLKILEMTVQLNGRENHFYNSAEISQWEIEKGEPPDKVSEANFDSGIQ